MSPVFVFVFSFTFAKQMLKFKMFQKICVNISLVSMERFVSGTESEI